MNKRYIYNLLALLCISIIVALAANLLYKNGFYTSSDVNDYLRFVLIVFVGLEIGYMSIYTYNDKKNRRKLVLSEAFIYHITIGIIYLLIFLIGMTAYVLAINVETAQFIAISAGIYFVFYAYNLIYTLTLIRRIKRENMIEDE